MILTSKALDRIFKEAKDELIVEPTATDIIYFKHVYFTNGFSISKAMFDGDKDYEPESRHGCLSSGIYCHEQLQEVGIIKGTLFYIYVRIVFFWRGIKRFLRLNKAT